MSAGRVRHVVFVTLIATLVCVPVTSVPAIGASTTPAGHTYLPKAGQPWTATKEFQPQAASAAVGVGFRYVRNKRGRVFAIRLERFDTSIPPTVVDSVFERFPVAYPGFAFNIEDDNTIVVVAAGRHNVSAQTWNPGSDTPGPWTSLLTKVKYENFASVTMDDAGDIVLLDQVPRERHSLVLDYSEANGWSAARQIDEPVEATTLRYPPAVELSPDGRIETLSIKDNGDGTMTTSVPRMPIDGTVWTQREVLATEPGKVELAGLDLGPSGGVAFHEEQRGRLGIVGVSTATGTQVRRSRYVAMMDDTGQGTARFVVGTVHGALAALSYDHGWTQTHIAGSAHSWYECAAVNSAGDITIGDVIQHHGRRLFATTWPHDSAPGALQPTIKRQVLYAFCGALDDGEAWVGADLAANQARDVYTFSTLN